MKRISMGRMDAKSLSFYISGLFLILFSQIACVPIQSTDANASASSLRQPLASSEGNSHMVQAGQIIQEALVDQIAQHRSAAAEVISSTRQYRFLPSLRRLLRDPIVPVRFSAILAIGDSGYTPAQQDLFQIHNETQEDLNVRMAAAYALYRIGHRQYADFYINQISNPDQTIRANAAMLIGKGGHREAVDHLFWALQDSRSQDRVHMQAAYSIARLGDPRITEKLWTRLISSYVDDRIDGIRAMGALGTQQAAEAIETMLDDPEFEVQLVAAEQLGRLGNRSGQAEVLTALKTFMKPSKPLEKDQQIRIKIIASAAIGEIGTPSLTKYLDTLLADESAIVRIAAARAIFCIESKQRTAIGIERPGNIR